MFGFLENVDLEQYPLISLRKIIEELPLVSQKQQEKFSVKELNSAVFSKITTLSSCSRKQVLL